jgi:hypothetical protein
VGKYDIMDVASIDGGSKIGVVLDFIINDGQIWSMQTNKLTVVGTIRTTCQVSIITQNVDN